MLYLCISHNATPASFASRTKQTYSATSGILLSCLFGDVLYEEPGGGRQVLLVRAGRKPFWKLEKMHWCFFSRDHGGTPIFCLKKKEIEDRGLYVKTTSWVDGELE